MEAKLLSIVSAINTYLSNYILVILLIGVGLLFTIGTKFVQIRCFGEGMKKVFGNIKLNGGKNKSGLSSFQALATAIAAQVGTGNIVGACGAILIGGPGAIFWMWIIAFFGMATIYGEAVLAQETRIKEGDDVKGGPVYYIKKAFSGGFGKFLAVFFAVAATLALGFMGSMVQSNSIAGSFNNAFGVPGWIVGIVLVVISGIIFLGGVQRIAQVTEKLVPIMAILYLIGGLVIIIARIKYIPATFGLIFSNAFSTKAIIGGGIGAAITQGAKRGLFSNEAGMGSTPHAHAMANVEKPHDQGVVAMIGVFIDTFVVLTMTALIVISTLYTGQGKLTSDAMKEYAANNREAIIAQENGEEILAQLEAGQVNNETAVATGDTKATLAQTAFGGIFGANLGNIFVAICLLFFAFSTILGWNFFGKINFEFLFGKKSVPIYSVIALVFIFLGTIASNDLVWELTDMFNNLMVIPNVCALVALCAIVFKSAKNAYALKKNGKNK